MCVCLDRPLTGNFKSAYLRKIIRARTNCLNAKIYCDHGVLTIFFNDRASEQLEARRTRLDTEHERINELRAREQPEARQARLNRQCERNNESRAMEQSEARQSGLERLHERNRQQRAAEQVDSGQARLTRIWEANQRRRQAETHTEPKQTSMCH